MAIVSRSCVGSVSTASKRTLPRASGRVSSTPRWSCPKENRLREAFRAALHGVGRDYPHRREGGGDGAPLRIGGTGRRGLGRVLPQWLSSLAARAGTACRDVGDGGGRRSAVAVRGELRHRR